MITNKKVKTMNSELLSEEERRKIEELENFNPNDYKDFTSLSVICQDLTKLDLSKVIFNPQTVKNKDLTGANLENLDLSQVDFTGVKIIGANLVGTGAHIDPQKIKDKDLSYADLEGLDLSQADFRGVDISGTILFGTGANTAGAIDKISFDINSIDVGDDEQ